MTVNLTKWFGVQFRVMRGSNDRRYLVAIGWLPRSRRLLHYWRASMMLPG